MGKNFAVCEIFANFAPAKATPHFGRGRGSCIMDVQWCNGSTTGFGSVCGGSNPPWTTKNYSLKTNYYGKSIFIRR